MSMTNTVMNSEMEDSGMSTSGVLKLSTSDSHAAAAEPLVKMPQSHSMQDSGICGDLLKRLSLNGSQEKVSTTPLERVREFYEPDEDGDAQLHLAVAAGLADVFEALVRMSPSPHLLSLQNNQGYSPLHLAVLQNQPAFVRRLVVAGAKLNLRDNEGNSPLHLSSRRGYVECAEALLRPLAVHETKSAAQKVEGESIIDQRNYQGEHCVHLAAMGGHIAFLQFLSWNGADLNALEGRGGRSALHLAVGAKNLALVQCLAEPRPTGLAVNTDLVDWCGRTAYHLSLLNKHQDIANYLAPKSAAANWTTTEMWLDGDSETEDEIIGHLVNSSA